MANFVPQWDLSAASTVITEGQNVITKLIMSKSGTSTSDTYTLSSDQYAEMVFTISSSGDTLEDRDFNFYIGTDSYPTTLIADASTGNSAVEGEHTVTLPSGPFTLGTDGTLDVYYFRLNFIDDGVWDDTETITITINSITVITTKESQTVNEDDFGEIETSSVTITYSNDDPWLTPNLTVRGELYTIGEISYGASSSVFAQAYGVARPYDSSTDGTDDTSKRIYIPTYKVSTVEDSEIPSTHISSLYTKIVPNSTDVAALADPTRLSIIDTANNTVNTGLKFYSNGQILSTMLYDADQADAYIKYELVAMDYYEAQGSQYYEDKKFRAYQTWIAPADDDGIAKFMSDSQPTKNHVYMLKDTTTYPYTVTTDTENNEEKLVFESDVWLDLGVYDKTLEASLVGSTKIFRIVTNATTGTSLSFSTDSDLGTVHVGEYFGHSVYPQIVAEGDDLISYTLSDSSTTDIRKYNIKLSADGYLQGTVFANSSDFNSNDEIDLEFDVIATARDGTTLTGTFTLTIVRGMEPNFMSAHLVPTTRIERQWYQAITTSVFSSLRYYRESDERYGLQRTPRILLKENFLNSSTFTWDSISTTKALLSNGIINTTSGSPIPESSFKLVMGNYKVRSALDSSGNILYDVLYREIHPEGTNVEVSTSSTTYSDISEISEFYGLRQNIYLVLGEDTANLLTDSDDLKLRGLVVDEIDGISDQMVDTVPRFMNHPYDGDGAEAGMLICAVVAYLPAGKGAAAFNALVTAGEHTYLVGEEFDVSYVQFKHFNTDSTYYSTDSFMIPLQSYNLLQ